MKKFHLKIVTPVSIVLDKKVRQITFRTPSAVRGILPGHIPFMAPLVGHIMKVHYDENQIEYFSVRSGFIRFIKDECIIVTDKCYNIRDISKETLDQEKDTWEKEQRKEKENKIKAQMIELQLKKVQKETERKK